MVLSKVCSSPPAAETRLPVRQSYHAALGKYTVRDVAPFSRTGAIRMLPPIVNVFVE
jgi:hypothetical protein